MLQDSNTIQHAHCHQTWGMPGKALFSSHCSNTIHEIDHCTAFGPCSARHMTPTSFLSTQERTQYSMRIAIKHGACQERHCSAAIAGMGEGAWVTATALEPGLAAPQQENTSQHASSAKALAIRHKVCEEWHYSAAPAEDNTSLHLALNAEPQPWILNPALPMWLLKMCNPGPTAIGVTSYLY